MIKYEFLLKLFSCSSACCVYYCKCHDTIFCAFSHCITGANNPRFVRRLWFWGPTYKYNMLSVSTAVLVCIYYFFHTQNVSSYFWNIRRRYMDFWKTCMNSERGFLSFTAFSVCNRIHYIIKGLKALTNYEILNLKHWISNYIIWFPFVGYFWNKAVLLRSL